MELFYICLQAFAIGGMFGFAVGPIGLWAVFLRMRGNTRGAYDIILGGAVIDTFVAVICFSTLSHFFGEGSWLSAVSQHPLVRGIGFIATGGLLLFLNRKVSAERGPSRFGPLLAAMLNSLEPTNALAMGAAAAYFGITASGSLLVLFALVAGVWTSWILAVEGLALLRDKRVGHVMGMIVRAACIAAVLWGTALVVYAVF